MSSGRLPRVLLLNWRDLRNPLAGGAEVHSHEVLRRLAQRGWPVTQISHAVPGLPARETIDGVEIHREGGANTFNYTAYARMRRWVREENAGIVIDDSNKFAFFAPQICPVPVVALIHHLFGDAIWNEASIPAGMYVRFSEWLVPQMYRDTVVMTGSDSTRAELLELGIRTVVNVGEGVDLDGYRLPEAGERDPNRLLYLGRVKKYKGLEVLLKTVGLLKPRFPGVYLDVAGGGDDVPRLKAIAAELGIAESVRFLGRVSEEEKLRLYRQSAVCLNSSVKEGWGLTSIEANGCGTPVVASDVPGLCDSVQDGVTGFLVPFGDAPAMAGRVAEILSDPGLAARLQHNALAWAREHSWDRVTDRTEEVLKRRLGLAE